MGLDMYICKSKKQFSSAVDFQEDPDYNNSSEEICYWRKHSNLHGLMHELYKKKGGQDPDFNVRPLALDENDIDHICSSILNKELPQTTGFFFGQSNLDEEEIEDDLKQLATARAAIKEGYTVFYYAWW